MSKEKKIIIDEDWKSQVASEREAMEKEAAGQDAQQTLDGGSPGNDTSGSDAQGSPQQGRAGMLPPASLEMLVTTLAAEAMISMGQMPAPGSEQPQIDLPQSKYVIDLLAVLQEKTKGNLTEHEEKVMQEVLHQLRVAYVAVQGST